MRPYKANGYDFNPVLVIPPHKSTTHTLTIERARQKFVDLINIELTERALPCLKSAKMITFINHHLTTRFLLLQVDSVLFRCDYIVRRCKNQQWNC